MSAVRRSCLGLVAGWVLLLCLPAGAGVVETDEFSSETLRLRYLDLVEELRCPKCQNQNLADSNSAISVDLRAEIRRLLEEGRSDWEITEYLVERYGDFVRYRPPLKSTTWLLWGAPGLLVLVALFALWWIKRQRRPEAEATQPLSHEERRKLDSLLQASPEGQVSVEKGNVEQGSVEKERE